MRTTTTSEVSPVSIERLRGWYRQTGRPLPWRMSHDPYAIWISEIMLQQTTVAAVVPYFNRFLARFPTVRDLAEAEEVEVLSYWEGLGYYSRARNLRKAAIVIQTNHKGVIPRDHAELLKLPGIGRYTAGAIASFAFDLPVPIVEANTLRLYCRLLNYQDNPRTAKGQQTLWDFAARIVPTDGPGEINQALMELGATVCTPTEPDCGVCPLRAECAAYCRRTVNSVPLRIEKAPMTPLKECAVCVFHGDRVLLMKRNMGERWAGLWDFLRFDISEASAGIAEHLNGRFRISADVEPPFTTMRHVVTRYQIQLSVHRAQWIKGKPVENGREFRWVSKEEIESFPLPVTGRRIARLLYSTAADSPRAASPRRGP